MKKQFLFLFLFISLLSFITHFWNYKSLVGFTLDSPIHLTGAKEMVDSGKLSLIGPSITSKEVMGRMFFLGPFYYYVLAILGILTQWNVIVISGFFTCLWLITSAILFFWLNKRFGGFIALILFTLLSFYPFFIQISRQIWNLQFIPLFGTLFLLSIIERKKPIHYFYAGIFWGLGLNVHYMTMLWVFIVIPIIISELFYKSFVFKKWLIFVLGIVIAELPLIIFEFRHNFYNLNTLFFQIKYGEFSTGYTFNIWYYYVLPFLPLAIFTAGFILHKIKKYRAFNLVGILLVILSIYSIVLSFGPTGQKPMHFPGWSIATQKKVAEIIINDQEDKFEVAETISSDTRATDIRWWLSQKHIDVMAVDKYFEAPVLYLVTSVNRPPETETVWEVSSLRPFKVLFNIDLGEGLLLYKIVRM